MPEEMKKSYQEIMKIFMMGGFDPGVVYKGAEAPLQNEETAGEGAGISALIEEAMKEEKRPLFVICQGALTNIASAILKQPEICERMLLVIIGGTNYPVGGYEFNTMNDPAAFNVVMKSKVPCWIIPEEVYSTMQVGMAELVEKSDGPGSDRTVSGTENHGDGFCHVQKLCRIILLRRHSNMPWDFRTERAGAWEIPAESVC